MLQHQQSNSSLTAAAAAAASSSIPTSVKNVERKYSAVSLNCNGLHSIPSASFHNHNNNEQQSYGNHQKFGNLFIFKRQKFFFFLKIIINLKIIKMAYHFLHHLHQIHQIQILLLIIKNKKRDGYRLKFLKKFNALNQFIHVYMHYII